MKIAIIVIVVLVGLGLIGALSSSDSERDDGYNPNPSPRAGGAAATPAEKDKPTTAGDAVLNARYAVRRSLKNPDNAKFPPIGPDYGASEETPGRWRVSGWVDATNSFGATLRQDWIVGFTEQPEGRYHVHYVALGDNVVLDVPAKEPAKK